jgi:hypothetical protein
VGRRSLLPFCVCLNCFIRGIGRIGGGCCERDGALDVSVRGSVMDPLNEWRCAIGPLNRRFP